MANNEVSGPAVVTYLTKWLQEVGELNWSYRIILFQKQLDLSHI